ncbi:hypothetical protein JHU04_001866 [Brenneria sp. 4F2]|nr:hypothetical protein [Brenneria bubanii]
MRDALAAPPNPVIKPVFIAMPDDGVLLGLVIAESSGNGIDMRTLTDVLRGKRFLLMEGII